MYYNVYVIGKENIASNAWAVVLLIEEDAISVVPHTEHRIIRKVKET